MDKSKILNIIVYILGVGLICAVFFALLPDILTENVFWVDLAVSVVVFTLFMFNMGRLVHSNDDMNTNWGSLGVRWFFMWTYAILAASGMVWMYFAALSFSIQIIIQSAFLLLLLFGFLFTMVINKQVRNVAQQQRADSTGLTDMKNIVARFEIHISSKNPDKNIVSTLNEIKDNIRYMSPSPNTMALELENQFIEELSEALTSIPRSDKTLNTDEVLSKLKSCNIILQQRKNFRYN